MTIEQRKKAALEAFNKSDYPPYKYLLAEHFETIRAALSEKDPAPLVEALEAVDSLWEGDYGLIKETKCCEELKWDSPVLIIHRQIKQALSEFKVNPDSGKVGGDGK